MEEISFWMVIVRFLFMTVLLGGFAAYRAGKTLAAAWDSRVVLVLYMLLLAAAIRFLHTWVFEDQFYLSDGSFAFSFMALLGMYVLDLIVMVAAAQVGYQLERAQRMTKQYYWLYERKSAFTWEDKAQPGA